ncbi:hypothetical protein Pint_20683 [Pistacia integerrima]|uniref:Uncharacterized protein n=1 Tax=Pistacia integerrima TaxID=434235 RepID=A0ACC0XD74_9ROSI|nr:hypothetical protein Pint_20683 [Pistacia integerrima]
MNDGGEDKQQLAIYNDDHRRARRPFNQGLLFTKEDKPVGEEPHKGVAASTQSVTVSLVRKIMADPVVLANGQVSQLFKHYSTVMLCNFYFVKSGKLLWSNF